MSETQLSDTQQGRKKVATTPLRVMATFARLTPAVPVRFPIQACYG